MPRNSDTPPSETPWLRESIFSRLRSPSALALFSVLSGSWACAVSAGVGAFAATFGLSAAAARAC
jgi:hypothetical protein